MFVLECVPSLSILIIFQQTYFFTNIELAIFKLKLIIFHYQQIIKFELLSRTIQALQYNVRCNFTTCKQIAAV